MSGKRFVVSCTHMTVFAEALQVAPLIGCDVMLCCGTLLLTVSKPAGADKLQASPMPAASMASAHLSSNLTALHAPAAHMTSQQQQQQQQLLLSPGAPPPHSSNIPSSPRPSILRKRNNEGSVTNRCSFKPALNITACDMRHLCTGTCTRTSTCTCIHVRV